jgi:hypothetical protein
MGDDDRSGGVAHRLMPTQRRMHPRRRAVSAAVAAWAVLASETSDDHDDHDHNRAYCVHALSAAAELRSKAAIRRLVALILDGLRPIEP